MDLTADQSVFLADFGESVVYRPTGGGTVRTISAIVDRNPPEAFGEVGNTPAFFVTVANSATTGIAMSTISMRADMLDISERHGEAAVSRRIARIVRHDAAMITLEVR